MCNVCWLYINWECVWTSFYLGWGRYFHRPPAQKTAKGLVIKIGNACEQAFTLDSSRYFHQTPVVPSAQTSPKDSKMGGLRPNPETKCQKQVSCVGGHQLSRPPLVIPIGNACEQAFTLDSSRYFHQSERWLICIMLWSSQAIFFSG